MANTYKKVYLHIVFAVKNRTALLQKEWRQDLFAYIAATLKTRGHYSLAVNGYNDHIHILIDYNLKELVSDIVREIKKSGSNYIKDRNLLTSKFEWQSGYGVFSVGWREKKKIIAYIKNQEAHHKKRAFRDEYMSLLNKYDIEFKNEYMFQFFDDVS